MDMQAQEHQKQNKMAFISGASSGIGAATAETLANRGYDLFLIARRKDRLQDLKNKILGTHKNCQITVAEIDIRSRTEMERFIADHGDQLKNLTVIINNAGLAKGTKTFQGGHLDDYEQMLDTNIRGLIYSTKLLLPFLQNNHLGHIVNLGSVAGRWVYPGGAVYCASKFAIRALSEGLRQDLIGTGIRVTNIEPGMVNTEFSLVRLGHPQQAEAVYQGMTPLSAADIAETIDWCLMRPPHVNIQEVVIFPTDQASVGQVFRKG